MTVLTKTRIELCQPKRDAFKGLKRCAHIFAGIQRTPWIFNAEDAPAETDRRLSEPKRFTMVYEPSHARDAFLKMDCGSFPSFGFFPPPSLLARDQLEGEEVCISLVPYLHHALLVSHCLLAMWFFINLEARQSSSTVGGVVPSQTMRTLG